MHCPFGALPFLGSVLCTAIFGALPLWGTLFCTVPLGCLCTALLGHYVLHFFPLAMMCTALWDSVPCTAPLRALNFALSFLGTVLCLSEALWSVLPLCALHWPCGALCFALPLLGYSLNCPSGAVWSFSSWAFYLCIHCHFWGFSLPLLVSVF